MAPTIEEYEPTKEELLADGVCRRVACLADKHKLKPPLRPTFWVELREAVLAELRAQS